MLCQRAAQADRAKVRYCHRVVETVSNTTVKIPARKAVVEPELALRPALLRLGLIAAATSAIALEHGFYPGTHIIPIPALRAVQVVMLIAHAVLTMRTGIFSSKLGDRIRSVGLFAVLLLGIMMSFAGEPLGWRLVEVAIVLRFFGELWTLNVVLSRHLARPAALFPLSFVLLIVIGMFLLKLPRAVPQGESINWIDALFTSTSAVCVTGLAVRSTAHDFTMQGQAIIAMLIQLGGLGIIMFGSTLVMLLGRNLSLKQNQNLSEMLNDQPMHRLLSYGRFVLGTTILIESIGAAMLYPLWDASQYVSTAQPVFTSTHRLWMSVFHSISAFCNAGFDITGSSMEGYRTSLLVHGVLVPLIVIGGIGFPVLDNLKRIAIVKLHRRRHPGGASLPDGFTVADSRLSLHSRIVLYTTAWVYLYGVVAISASQVVPMIANADAAHPITASQVTSVMADASFLAITSRTAGFDTMPANEMQPGTVLTTMTLMLVGGSPGSTAGGIKTTTLAVLVLSIFATMHQRKEAEAFGRTIADVIVRKAGTLGMCYFGLIVLTTLGLALVEPFSLDKLLFESISAATTTGLSLGITSDLSPLGRLILIAAMFLGRVGPLALLTVLIFGPRNERPYTYAHEGVALG